ncbi:SDR family NAD(P)-dependent oxidoreductase [Sphingomonas sp. LB2R24]|uniref:SDR family NAD(P)-dependent oxidoreductase n=1 Tax=Sphingomonas sorbitolis TaxID=3096165 RepID=UPI002FCBBB83
MTDFAAIPAAVAKAERHAGAVEVLVNNAGYGHEGALEESSMDDLQRQFAANVYGPVAMMKAVLQRGVRTTGRHYAVCIFSREWKRRLNRTASAATPPNAATRLTDLAPRTRSTSAH